jgi:hypothetical protein
VFIEKSGADFFTLTMMQEALKTHENHHVITDDSAWYDVLGKRGGPLGDKGTRFIATSCRTDMDSLADLELTMGDSLAVMGECLLYMPSPAADRALSRVTTDRYEYS